MLSTCDFSRAKLHGWLVGAWNSAKSLPEIATALKLVHVVDRKYFTMKNDGLYFKALCLIVN